MLSPFLTDPERKRFGRFPAPLNEFDLRQYFHLTDQDREMISLQRRDANRIGFALQICLIRFLGFIPENWIYQVPEEVVTFISEQLGMDSAAFLNYGQRGATRTTHFQEVLTYLRYRKWEDTDSDWLGIWLLERAMEHDRERLLLELACQKLMTERIVRPSIWVLERLISQILLQTDAETYRRLKAILTPVLEERLDQLLLPSPLLTVTPHRWLCRPSNANTPNAIREAIRKLCFLKELGVAEWDVTGLNANRCKRMALLTRKRTNQALQRYAPEKRYPLLVVFLKESYLDLTDAILTMFSDFWESVVGKAKRELEEYQQKVAQSKDQALQTLGKAAMLVVDEQTVPDQRLRQEIYQQIPRESLLAALENCQLLLRPTRHSYLEFLDGRYPLMKQFSGHMLQEIAFQSGFAGDDFWQALQLVVELQTGKRKKLPSQVHLEFMTPTWKGFVLQGENQVGRRAYELCVLSTLRDRLRSGDIFVDHSRKFADLESYLIPPQQWEILRAEVCQQLGLPLNSTERLNERLAELESYLPLMEELLQQGGDIRLEEGELVISPLEASELSESFLALEKEVMERMPQVDLTELLVEVDGWTSFSTCLQGLDSSLASKTSSGALHQNMLYAVLLAAGCNVSLTDMARSSGLNYQSLWWTAHNHLQENTLRQANSILVNFHHRHPLSASWGGGTLSSSDGQRFPVSGKIRNAKSIPRYFGYGKGVTFYTHTSDQYSQYGSRVIASTIRDATVLLDEILDNQTELVIQEHTTDTSGQSNMLFALFDLSALLLSPRIRDLKDQKLCKIKNKEWTYPNLKFTGSINPDYIAQHWDAMLRVVGSFKLGYVTASLFISKLQSYPRQNNLTYVLQQYGQLIKTIYILRYLQSKPLRRKIHAQLNKGECLHALRCFLWFGGDGSIRRKQEEDQQEVVSCLNVITNLVVVWNTVYMQEIIHQLKAEGYPLREEEIQQLSPARYEHINRMGKYTFQVSEEMLPNGLRPLRKGKTAS